MKVSKEEKAAYAIKLTRAFSNYTFEVAWLLALFGYNENALQMLHFESERMLKLKGYCFINLIVFVNQSLSTFKK